MEFMFLSQFHTLPEEILILHLDLIYLESKKKKKNMNNLKKKNPRPP